MSAALRMTQAAPDAIALPTAAPGRRRRAFSLHRRVEEGGGAGARLHGLGPRLHDEQHAGFAVLRPFHVHRPSVVRLDGDRPARELENVRVVQHEGLAFGGLGLDDPGAPAAAFGVDHLEGLAAPLLLDDRFRAGHGEERL